MSRHLDLMAACEAFVSVAERESFTAGAAGVGLTQSVASRRIAALEAHFGARLFERTSRRVALTAFGRRMLPGAIKLVAAARELADDADQARLHPVVVAAPANVPPRAAARLIAAAAAGGITIELLEGVPAARGEWITGGRADLALQHVEPDRARWSSPLGVGWARPEPAPESGDDERPFHLAELRPRRGGAERRRLWLQPEDDVPNVRDRLDRVRNGAGLAPGHLRVASSPAAAMAKAIADDDLVLCTPAEAEAYDLAWHPLGDLHLLRGYALVHRDADLARRFELAAASHLPAVLGTSRESTDAN
ncbi:LysR family transcriptional regulator [Agromyces sp. LHK192]|uniref:LysR family transcriptional regulator n=1 Tax=Agromyces sp. LHK192 TaxID=2498704 RepID=UPI0013E3E891|nr:LysR family transcriptional regulator [Agromyces sp. LHK192]